MFNTRPMTCAGFDDDFAVFREYDTPPVRTRADGRKFTLLDDGARSIPVISFKLDRED